MGIAIATSTPAGTSSSTSVETEGDDRLYDIDLTTPPTFNLTGKFAPFIGGPAKSGDSDSRAAAAGNKARA